MKLHHLEICTKSGKKLTEFFTQKLGFQISATRQTTNGHQWVVSNNTAPFVVSESIQRGDGKDSVFNVALSVDNVHQLTEKMQSQGVSIVAKPSKTEDEDGSTIQSTIYTGFGNIVHTLIDRSSYSGKFLPGFKSVSQIKPHSSFDSMTDHIDHITYACWPGEMESIIQWYKHWFGLERHIMNEYDDVQDGLIIGGHIGIRLKAAKAPSGNRENFPFFLVLAEPLTMHDKNHVRVFLEEHGGPGVEHVAFSTSDILRTITNLKQRGLQFREAPKLDDLEETEEEKNLRKMDILKDTEGRNRFLYQAFTLPIFDEPTLFLEIIQRQGAMAFGAGNITRIMRSIEDTNLDSVPSITENPNRQ